MVCCYILVNLVDDVMNLAYYSILGLPVLIYHHVTLFRIFMSVIKTRS